MSAGTQGRSTPCTGRLETFLALHPQTVHLVHSSEQNKMTHGLSFSILYWGVLTGGLDSALYWLIERVVICN